MKSEIDELADIIGSTPGSSFDGNKSMLLKKIAYLMSDRAANEVLSNKQLTAWVQTELGDGDVKPIYSIYCMAHTLLGFQSYSIAETTKLQNETVEQDGVKFGRDSNDLFSTYSPENAARRAVRIAAQLLGPNGDEKNGLRGKWVADCMRRNVKSMIGDHRDNRFNNLFQRSAEVIYHIHDMISIEKFLINPNRKVQSLMLDLHDSRVVTMIQAYAIMYVKVTEPYWRLLVSRLVAYVELPTYIQKLEANIETVIANSSSMFDDSVVFIEGFSPDTTSPLYNTAMHIVYPDRQGMLFGFIQLIAKGILKTIQKQMGMLPYVLI